MRNVKNEITLYDDIIWHRRHKFNPKFYSILHIYIHMNITYHLSKCWISHILFLFSSTRFRENINGTQTLWYIIVGILIFQAIQKENYRKFSTLKSKCHLFKQLNMFVLAYKYIIRCLHHQSPARAPYIIIISAIGMNRLYKYMHLGMKIGTVCYFCTQQPNKENLIETQFASMKTLK